MPVESRVADDARLGGGRCRHGRTVRITPAPFRLGGPAVSLGGSSEPAARRAARIADGFIPSVPEVCGIRRITGEDAV